jgi:hypothetical protein
MTARDHNKLLSVLYFVLAGLQLLGGAVFGLIYIVIGGAALSTARRDEDQILGGIFLGLGLIIGLVMLVLGAVTLFAGFKVRKEQPVGRILGIIISVLILLNFPLGTALGIYGLWFFLSETGKNFYAGLPYASATPPAPPNPNSWQ